MRGTGKRYRRGLSVCQLSYTVVPSVANTVLPPNCAGDVFRVGANNDPSTPA